VDLRNVWRTDAVVPPQETDAILANAPQREGSLFRVPRILEEEE
jgi:Asp-tRNA(Asn)/Glu-tRNA(Gln) amidotransferase C subunit